VDNTAFEAPNAPPVEAQLCGGVVAMKGKSWEPKKQQPEENGDAIAANPTQSRAEPQRERGRDERDGCQMGNRVKSKKATAGSTIDGCQRHKSNGSVRAASFETARAREKRSSLLQTHITGGTARASREEKHKTENRNQESRYGRKSAIALTNLGVGGGKA